MMAVPWWIQMDSKMAESEGAREMPEWSRMMQKTAEDGAAIEAARQNDPAERLRVYLAQLEIHRQMVKSGASHALGVLEEAQNFFEYCLRLEQRVIALEDELSEYTADNAEAGGENG
jgi:hypothetical protein